LFSEGQTIRQVAAALVIGYETARTWCRTLEQSGTQAMCATKPRGRKPRLSAQQLEQLAVALTQGRRGKPRSAMKRRLPDGCARIGRA
jgi:transposase